MLSFRIAVSTTQCCLHCYAVLVLQICERSLTQSTGGPSGPTTPNFIRAEVLPSGYLIRPCEGGGSMIHIVDHVDLDVSTKAIISSSVTLEYFCETCI